MGIPRVLPAGCHGITTTSTHPPGAAFLGPHCGPVCPYSQAVKSSAIWVPPNHQPRAWLDPDHWRGRRASRGRGVSMFFQGLFSGGDSGKAKAGSAAPTRVDQWRAAAATTGDAPTRDQILAFAATIVDSLTAPECAQLFQW